MSENKFDHWAIVELMGHQRLAGRVSEQAIGGASFVRVDVPQVGSLQPFTKLFGNGAIYAITIVDEKTARAAAEQIMENPVDAWSIEKAIESMRATETNYDEIAFPETFSFPDDDDHGDEFD